LHWGIRKYISGVKAILIYLFKFLLIRVGGVFPKTPEMIPKDKDYKQQVKRKKEKK